MKQSKKKGARNQVGAHGEAIAVTYLRNNGLAVLNTNYLKKWGEIDIVARETSGQTTKIRFIEVKTVSYETKDQLQVAVSRGTWRPEENVHERKLQRMHRAIESWLVEHDCQEDWEIDIVTVRIVPRERYATIKYMKNIISG